VGYDVNDPTSTICLRTERKLSRDLNALERLGLIERVPEGWVPLRGQILAFQPVRRMESEPLEPLRAAGGRNPR
jgi:hypothetical protein